VASFGIRPLLRQPGIRHHAFYVRDSEIWWKSGMGQYLVGGLEHVLFFHGKNHPNWRSHIFQRGRSATHQILIGFNIINQLFLWENQLFLWPFSTGMQLGKVFIPMLGGSAWDGNGTALRFWGNGHQSIFIRIYVPIKPYEDEHIPSYTHNGPNI